jgi:O-succinylbenzoate synthase
MAAGLALAGALPELDFACGLGTLSLLDGDVTTDSLRPVDGTLPVPTRAPTPDRLPEHTADEETTTRWLARLDRVRALLT